jgi:hypothetical protein
MIVQEEIQALQNHCDSIPLDGLKVYEKYHEDKRKTVKMFFLVLNGTSISPVLDYENMNHFILGFSKGLKLTNKTT